MDQGERRFNMEPFELPDGTIVRASSEYPDHIHFTDPYGGEVNLPVRDAHLALVRLLLRLVSFLPGPPPSADEPEEAGSAYPALRRRSAPVIVSA